MIAFRNRFKGPAITVLLPARHARKTIDYAIKTTCRALDPARDKLLVILEQDDLETRRRVDLYDSSMIRTLLLPGPQTLSSKLNAGLFEAKTELVGRMDADDVTLPWRFTRQLFMYQKYESIVASTAIVFGWGLRPLPVLPQPPIHLSASQVRRALIIENPIVHPSVLAPRAALEMVGGYREVPGEDLDLWLRLANRGVPIVRDWLPSLLYRYSTNSMSHGVSNDLSQKASDAVEYLRRELIQNELGETFLGTRLSKSAAIDFLKMKSKWDWKLAIEAWDMGRNK